MTYHPTVKYLSSHSTKNQKNLWQIYTKNMVLQTPQSFQFPTTFPKATGFSSKGRCKMAHPQKSRWCRLKSLNLWQAKRHNGSKTWIGNTAQWLFWPKERILIRHSQRSTVRARLSIWNSKLRKISLNTMKHSLSRWDELLELKCKKDKISSRTTATIQPRNQFKRKHSS